MAVTDPLDLDGDVVGEGDGAAERRVGTLAGIAAYSLWGLFPLVFHRLSSVSALEVVLHRVVWSFAVVALVLVVRRDGRWRAAVRDRRTLGLLVAGGWLVAVNWLVYVWAVAQDHVVEAALGYYVNPLVTVALGVVVLDEHLHRAQAVALALGTAAVGVLTVALGRPPWIALVLAATFAAYGFVKKAAGVPAAVALAVETSALAPLALVGLVAFEVTGRAAFLHGSGWHDLLLVSLGAITAVPLLLFGVAATRIPLTLLGLLQYLTPTLQLVCGVAVLGEPLPPARLAGFVLVWLALVVLAGDALRRGRASRDVAGVAAPTPDVEAALGEAV